MVRDFLNSSKHQVIDQPEPQNPIRIEGPSTGNKEIIDSRKGIFGTRVLSRKGLKNTG